MATVSAGTFHVIHTELVVGILSLAAISLVLLCVLRLSPKIPFINQDQQERLVKAFDNTQMVSSAFGLIFIPIAMFSGIIASKGEATTDPILLNKIILSSISIGAWLAFVNLITGMETKGLDFMSCGTFLVLMALMCGTTEGLTIEGMCITVALAFQPVDQVGYRSDVVGRRKFFLAMADPRTDPAEIQYLHQTPLHHYYTKLLLHLSQQQLHQGE